jgi:PAS domain S-box-containing protein
LDGNLAKELAELVYKRQLSVLYVEDDENVRMPTSKLLERCCENLYVGCDGLEGFDLYKRHRPDIVVTDISMPNMDGLEMSREIKTLNQFVPIIVASAHFDSEFLFNAISVGVNQYITKPINFVQLLEKIDISALLVLELKQSLFTFQNYLKAIDSGFVFSKTDERGRITYANDLFCELYGYDYMELLDNTHGIIRSPNTPLEVHKDIWKTISVDKKVWKGRLTNRTKSGKDIITDTTIAPVLDLVGNVIEFFCLRDDKTEVIEQGKALERKEKELLEQQIASAKELEKSKESFLVVFTHELRTPLNSTINFSQFIQEELKIHVAKSDSFPMMIEFAKQIEQNGDFMLNIVNGMLDISKLKAGKMKFNICNFEPAASIEGIIRRLKGAENKGVTTETSADLDKNIIIESDMFRFDHIFSNIYSNALKYGKDKILVRLRQADAGFELSIHDNGGGIEHPERIFDLFEQCDDEHKNRHTTGTGIGLHYVKLLCENLGLGIEVTRSQELGGANFTIRGKVHN